MSKRATTAWPALPLSEWRETYRTLHMWTQMVGKVRLALTPLVNHWWNVTQYVSARGLTTSTMPCGDHTLEIEFDFVDHVLRLRRSDGVRRELPLVSQSVARFYERFLGELAALDVHCRIWPVPCEVEDPVRFTEDGRGEYDADAAQRHWRILEGVASVMNEFRARFLGKCSPAHFFWGSFDLAVTRFSGRTAPVAPDADAITREAYSHECSSVGFWPGGSGVDEPAFYSYTSPMPGGFGAAPIRPAKGRFNEAMGQFQYMYADMRAAPDPRAALLEFMQSSYEAGANSARWDRTALERTAQP